MDQIDRQLQWETILQEHNLEIDTFTITESGRDLIVHIKLTNCQYNIHGLVRPQAQRWQHQHVGILSMSNLHATLTACIKDIQQL